jgi:formate dehydrogenase major subunit
MTNSYNDVRNAKTILLMGGNPAEAHPVSLQHILEAKELNRANMIVVDPRMTRTAAHATEYVRVRPGTHIATIYGMLWHIFENGWEDKEFLSQRVYGVDEIRKQVAKWTPHILPFGILCSLARRDFLGCLLADCSLLSFMIASSWSVTVKS